MRNVATILTALLTPVLFVAIAFANGGTVLADGHGGTPDLPALDRVAFPDCDPIQLDEAQEHFDSASFVVVRIDGTIEHMAGDEARERMANDKVGDDVWPIGACSFVPHATAPRR